ncbi:MAG TPA: hypothetical protein VFH51_08395 [Myxococcota bacterium]|nr:hypothetical protein [Myxococcota bacterium]
MFVSRAHTSNSGFNYTCTATACEPPPEGCDAFLAGNGRLVDGKHCGPTPLLCLSLAPCEGKTRQHIQPEFDGCLLIVNGLRAACNATAVSAASPKPLAQRGLLVATVCLAATHVLGGV